MLGLPAPGSGRAKRAADTWCCRVAVDHAVLVGPANALARWRAVLRSAVVAGDRIAYGATDGAAAFASLIGPRAARVLEAFGLPGALPAGCVAAQPGPVGLLVREADDAFLLGFDVASAPAVRAALIRAGAPLACRASAATPSSACGSPGPSRRTAYDPLPDERGEGIGESERVRTAGSRISPAYARVEELIRADRCVVLDGGIGTELPRAAGARRWTSGCRA